MVDEDVVAEDVVGEAEPSVPIPEEDQDIAEEEQISEDVISETEEPVASPPADTLDEAVDGADEKEE